MNRHSEPVINDMVAEMWIVQAAWAVLCGVIGCFIVKDRMALIVGVVCGMVLSCAGTWHIWYTLNSSLGTGDDKSASRKVGGGYLFRYFALIILILILYFTGWGNPFAAFVAYLGMKPAAYLQPSLHRSLHKDINEEVR